MKNYPKLINVTQVGGNYGRRVKRNYEAWELFYSPKNRKSKSLTDYANHLLDGKLKPLYDLVFNYSGSRMFITHKKHQILMNIRKTHASDVENQLKQMLIDYMNQFRVIGAVRSSDKFILSKFNKN